MEVKLRKCYRSPFLVSVDPCLIGYIGDSEDSEDKVCKLGNFQDTLRLFLTYLDFSDDGANGSRMLYYIMGLRSWPRFLPTPALEWTLRLLCNDVRHSLPDSAKNNLIGRIIEERDLPEHTKVQLVETVLNVTNEVKTSQNLPGSYSTSDILGNRGMDIMKELALGSRYSHLGPWRGDLAKGLEMELSFALSSSDRFSNFWGTLIQLGVDFKDFVREMLKESSLVTKGWTEKKLLAIFYLDFEKLTRRLPRYCSCCGDEISLHELWQSHLSWIWAKQELIMKSGEELNHTKGGKEKNRVEEGEEEEERGEEEDEDEDEEKDDSQSIYNSNDESNHWLCGLCHLECYPDDEEGQEDNGDEYEDSPLLVSI